VVQDLVKHHHLRPEVTLAEQQAEHQVRGGHLAGIFHLQSQNPW
jgi:hypothetical protein